MLFSKWDRSKSWCLVGFCHPHWIPEKRDIGIIATRADKGRIDYVTEVA